MREQVKSELADQFIKCWNQGAGCLNSAMRVVLLVVRLTLVTLAGGVEVVDEKWLKEGAHE